jgi:dUTP pyrophosphatase
MIKFTNKLGNGQTPIRGTPGSAGYDIHSAVDIVVPVGQHIAISTDVYTEFPPDTVCFIKPRSGLAFKHAINVLAGVVDSDYRGEIKVILINHGTTDFKVSKGDRIAQLVFLGLTLHSTNVVVEDTISGERGTGGFGSTGMSDSDAAKDGMHRAMLGLD